MPGQGPPPSREEAAYFAGFFDGEGSVMILRRDRPGQGCVAPVYTAGVSVSQTFLPPG